MINPAMFGINPQQMEMAQEVGKHLRMELKRYHKEGRLEVRYIPVNPDEAVDLSSTVDALSEQLMWGHANFFGMKGKLIDVD